MYALQKRADPQPWIDEQGHRTVVPVSPTGERHRFAPRPEEENTPNPLLALLRDTLADGEYVTGELAANWARLIDAGHDWAGEGLTVTPDQVEHARRVFGLLAGPDADLEPARATYDFCDGGAYAIDPKGWIYCAEHKIAGRGRKLRGWEKKWIAGGHPLPA